jgi:hypothetical protein
MFRCRYTCCGLLKLELKLEVSGDRNYCSTSVANKICPEVQLTILVDCSDRKTGREFELSSLNFYKIFAVSSEDARKLS